MTSLSSLINIASIAGRKGDSTMAHLTPGELVIPRSAQTPGMMALFAKHMRSRGQNPAKYMVGSSFASQNPVTGAPEFGDEGDPGPGAGDYSGGYDRSGGDEGGGSSDASSQNNPDNFDLGPNLDFDDTNYASILDSASSLPHHGGQIQQALQTLNQMIEQNASNLQPNENLDPNAAGEKSQRDYNQALANAGNNLSWFETVLDYMIPGTYPALPTLDETGNYVAGKGLGFSPSAFGFGLLGAGGNIATGTPLPSLGLYVAGLTRDPKTGTSFDPKTGISMPTQPTQWAATSNPSVNPQGQQVRAGQSDPDLGREGGSSFLNNWDSSPLSTARLLAALLPQEGGEQVGADSSIPAPWAPGQVDTTYGYFPEQLLFKPWEFNLGA